MNKKLMSIQVTGVDHKWCFEFYADPKYLHDWEKDGLDIVVLENTIPVWTTNIGLTKVWCFMQDLFNFKNPFK